MKAALEDISKIPPDQLPSADKIWARDVRELSYDIEDNIDTFMVQVKGHQPDKKHGFSKKLIDKTLGSLMKPKIRHKVALDIRDIKSRLVEVHDRRRSYEVNYSVDKPVKVDPRALVRYEKVTNLVAIEESRNEVIKILMEGNQVSKQQDKTVSLVGFGGLGKTTLANVVYEKIRPQFDCSAFVSVSQTPDMDRLFRDMFYKLTEENAKGIDVIDELRKFLQGKRYLVIIDDIWEISHWNLIRCALPDDDDSVEYRIITTRNFMVAEKIGGPYKMKHLSLENSKILMYRRIFGKEDNYPNEDLEEVSNKILKKCGGVPLAIITIASLLASKGRNKLNWYDVCNSIGTGLENDNTIENMRKVLLLSYYDMPSHLRTCLLYLSMFPEDYDIRKDRLIWLWIAEGFIQHEKQEKGIFDKGENYFNELVNRSMIQPMSMYKKAGGLVESCRVHDMVLDLICSLSSEENFVTMQNNMVHSSTSKKVRRLSLQTYKAGHGTPEATLTKEHHVRSVIIFQSAIDDYMPTILENFCILRVLDLEWCDLSQVSLKYLGNLLHLRYLSLRGTLIDHLPEEIGNLQFLQMLDLCSFGEFPCLPSSIVRLAQLVCLHTAVWTKVPEGIGSLIALEELSWTLGIDERKMLEELAHLTNLRVFHLTIDSSNSYDKSLVECLNKLQKIQSLKITIHNRKCYLDGWVVTAPQNLRALDVHYFDPKDTVIDVIGTSYFVKLPPWLKVNPTLLRNLSFLRIGMKRLQQEDLEILGRLPALRYLFLTVDHEKLAINGRLVVCTCSFPCLVHCELWGFGGPVVFEQGAMPRLMDLYLQFQLEQTREMNSSFDLGIRNLPSLQKVKVWLGSGGASNEEVEEAKAAMWQAIEVHPNHPDIEIWR